MTQIADLLIEFHYRKSLAEQAVKDMTDAQDDLVKEMQKRGAKTVSVTLDGQVVTGTLVEGTRIVIDEPKLRKKIGAKLFDLVTKRVLDRPKLEAAMAGGVIDPNVVAEVSEEVFNKPYVRLNVKIGKPYRRQSEAGRKVRRKQ